jgi:hypothetical protein
MPETWHVQPVGSRDYVTVDMNGVKLLVSEGRFTPECHVYDHARGTWVKALDSPLAIVFDEQVTTRQPVRFDEQERVRQVGQERSELDRSVEDQHQQAMVERERLYVKLNSIKAQLISDPTQTELAHDACDTCDKLGEPEHAATILRDTLAFAPGEPSLVRRLRVYIGDVVDKEPNTKPLVPYERNIVGQVLAYPFREGGIAIFLFPIGVWLFTMIASLAAAASLVFLILAWTVLAALYGGYAVPLFLTILRTSAEGRDTLPHVDFMDWFEYIPEMLAFVIGMLVYCAPVFLAMLALGYKAAEALSWAGVYVPVIESLVGPWLLIALFVEERPLMAYNPIGLVRGAVAIGPRYWLAVGLVFAIAVPVITVGAFVASGSRNLAFVVPVAEFYVFVIQARIVGLLYRDRRHACRTLFE